MKIECIVPEMHIDPSRSRFPCCIVWTSLPLISWFFPFIGHMGICREDGVILDFAGPNFVSVDNFAFGKAARYIPINIAVNESTGSEILTWDGALQKSTQEFQHRRFCFLTCNCHCFVANCLNRLFGGGWDVVNLATPIFFKGHWVSYSAMARSILSFVVVCILGFLFGGWVFFKYVTAFGLLLVAWFIIGTWWLKCLIHL